MFLLIYDYLAYNKHDCNESPLPCLEKKITKLIYILDQRKIFTFAERSMIAGQRSNLINYNNKSILHNLKFQSFDTLMSRPRQKNLFQSPLNHNRVSKSSKS